MKISPLISHISTLLIANRGEISSRLARTCRKMGIRSVAVYSEADRGSKFVRDADTAIYIGGSQPSQSYLDQDKVIAAAKKTGADAIHPGYGFLSENAEFAKRCEREGILFIGPNPDAIQKMGLKSEAKELMSNNEVPVIPGYQGDDQSDERLRKEAVKLGFPLLLKASAGGGGKGMRIVNKEEEISAAISAAKREAKSAFGNEDLILEKYIESGRHIEFQIFGDKHGNVIHILERECSIQRRFQKVIEESPSPVMDEELRHKMGEAAVNAAKALQYDNAGTVEFIYDDQSGDFYFLEVNTRLQVEHPVTEAITGLDLVAMQIESASGQPLHVTQASIKGTGYAIEARLYAEDPSNNFLPQTGKIHQLEFPCVDGLRIESAVESRSEVSIYYDPMIAKIIVHDKDRRSAIRKLNFVLRNTICFGLTTNLSFLIELTNDEEFINGNYNTHFIAQKDQLSVQSKSIDIPLIAASQVNWHQRNSQRSLLKSLPSGWRNNFYEPQKEIYKIDENEYNVKYTYNSDRWSYYLNDKEYSICLIALNNSELTIEVDERSYLVKYYEDGNTIYIHNEDFLTYEIIKLSRFPEKESKDMESGYKTSMPASIVKVLVQSGQEVHKGDPLVVLSSMKMESTIEAIEDGLIEEVYVEEGNNVSAGTDLVKLLKKKAR